MPTNEAVDIPHFINENTTSPYTSHTRLSPAPLSRKPSQYNESPVAKFFRIPELVDMLCLACYNPILDGGAKGISQPRLAALVLVNKFISRLAMKVLWKHLFSVKPLMNLLPGDLIHYSEERTKVEVVDGEDEEIPEPPEVLRDATFDDFNRYLFYAFFVEQIEVCTGSQMIYLPDQIFDTLDSILLNEKEEAYAFPRLNSLRLDTFNAIDQLGPCLHFFNENLRKIVVRMCGPYKEGYDHQQDISAFLGGVRSVCPNITELGIEGATCRMEHILGKQTSYKISSVMPLLQTITLWVSINTAPVLFNAFSNLASLQKLDLTILDAEKDLPDEFCDIQVPFPPPPLPQLRDLTLSGWPHLLASQLSFDAIPPAPNLQTIEIVPTAFDNDGVEALTLNLVSYARENIPFVKEILITSEHGEAVRELGESAPVLEPPALKELTKLANLTCIQMSVSIFIRVSPRNLEEFAYAWGHHLNILVLTPCPWSTFTEADVQITLEDITVFASRCTKLKVLGLVFKSDGVSEEEGTRNTPPLDEHYPVSRSLQRFIVGSSRIKSVKYTAACFRKAFPKLKLLEWSDSQVFPSMTTECDDKWQEVEDNLGLVETT